MSIDQTEPEHDGALGAPSVALDPVLAEALEDALAGPQVPTSALDPNRVLGADPHDFASLYLRHRSSFAVHARRFLRDPRDVDEVVQEAFLRLFLAMPELANELQALAYCRRTITNLCIDRYRADQRRPRLVDLESVPLDVLSDDEPADPVVQAEDAAIVREALALLTPLHREALVKREIEEKPLPQIAAELGVPEENVKHLLHRARRALRRRLVEAHAARGVDVDDVSTLSLLARSAVSGSGRVGALALLFLGLVLGVSTTRVPVQAFDTISGLWAPEEDAAPPSTDGAAAVEPGETAVVGQLPGVLGAERDYAGPVHHTSPLPPEKGGEPPLSGAAVPLSGPVSVTATVTTRPSALPSAQPPVAPSAAPTTSAEPGPLPTLAVDPGPEPSTDPTAAPSSRPTGDPVEPRPSLQASPVPTDPEPEPEATATTDGQPVESENGPVRMPTSAWSSGRPVAASH